MNDLNKTQNDTAEASEPAKSESGGAVLNESIINQQHEQGIVSKIKSAADFPIPWLKKEWSIPVVSLDDLKGSKGIMAGLMGKKKAISPERISKLEGLSHVSPGKVLIEVQELLNVSAENPDLYILAAVSKQRVLSMSGGNPADTIAGMKSATIFAGRALGANGMSIGNTDKFMQIYHTFLDRLKRAHQNVGRSIKDSVGDSKFNQARKDLAVDKKVLDFLFDEYRRSSAYTDHLRKVFSKSSQRKQIFDHINVSDAIVSLSKGEGSKQILYGTSAEVTEHTYLLLNSLARIPMLKDVVAHYQGIFNLPHISFQLRWTNIETALLTQVFRIAMIHGEKEKAASAAKKVFEMNYLMTKKLADTPLKKDYEFEPFFNLGRITLYSYTNFAPEMQAKMYEHAIKALEAAIKYDQSKKGNKAQTAIEMTTRLTEVMQLDRKKE